MTEREIQQRFNRDELVFTDGELVFMRVQRMGGKGRPWHYTAPKVRLFQGGNNAKYTLDEFCECHWWTWEYGHQLIKALAGLGITLTPATIEHLEWQQERRSRR